MKFLNTQLIAQIAKDTDLVCALGASATKDQTYTSRVTQQHIASSHWISPLAQY